jgi:hypothetical protein
MRIKMPLMCWQTLRAILFHLRHLVQRHGMDMQNPTLRRNRARHALRGYARAGARIAAFARKSRTEFIRRCHDSNPSLDHVKKIKQNDDRKRQAEQPQQ